VSEVATNADSDVGMGRLTRMFGNEWEEDGLCWATLGVWLDKARD
jgi:hypothetical protein